MNGTKVLKDVTAKQVTLRDGFRPSVKKVKIDSEDTSDFAICGLNNVISTANLIPPRWYDETKSGYVYLWINLTNLEKNKSIKDWKKKLPVYYLGYHGPELGYIKGTYWASPESLQWHDDKDNPKMKWAFKILEFSKTKEEAHDKETKRLKAQHEDKKNWKLYYNEAVGGSGINDIDNNSIFNLYLEAEQACEDFMIEGKYDKENKTRHTVGRFNIVFCNVKRDYDDELQLEDRQEDADVMSSVIRTTNKDRGAFNIRPIIGGVMKDKQYWFERLKKYIKGKIILHGLTRKSGVFSINYSRMWVLEIPEEITKDWKDDYFDEFAGYFNRPVTLPQQEMNDEWYVKRLISRRVDRKIPIESASNDEFLDNHNLSDERKKRIISQALDDKKLSEKGTAIIPWGKGVYATKAWPILKKSIEKPGVIILKMSMGSYKLSAIAKAIRKYEKVKDNPPVKKVYIYVYKKLGNSLSDWWSDTKAGLPVQLELLKIMPPQNNDNEKIDIVHRRLPEARLKIGGGKPENFWKSSIGKAWLDGFEIKLEDNK